MADGQLTLTSQELKTPRAAAIAGIVFALLFTSSVVLIRLSSLPIRRMAACGSKSERVPLLSR